MTGITKAAPAKGRLSLIHIYRIIFRYVADETLRGTARRLIREKKVCRSLDYPPDRSFKRRWYFCKNQMSYYKKYKKYFGNKGLTG